MSNTCAVHEDEVPERLRTLSARVQQDQVCVAGEGTTKWCLRSAVEQQLFAP